MGIKVYTEDGTVAAAFYSIKRRGDHLVLDSNILETMHMELVLTRGEVLQAARMALNWSVVSFVLLLPYFWLKQKFYGRRTRETA
jgi:hypothetical protein